MFRKMEKQNATNSRIPWQQVMDFAQGIKVEIVTGLRGNFYDVNGINLTQNLTFYRIGVHSKKIIIFVKETV